MLIIYITHFYPAVQTPPATDWKRKVVSGPANGPQKPLKTTPRNTVIVTPTGNGTGEASPKTSIGGPALARR